MSDKRKFAADTIIVKQLAKELMPEWKTNDWFEWPPDLFALTSILLKTTGIYRFAVSPHPDTQERLQCLDKEEIRETIREWDAWIFGNKKFLPGCLARIKRILFEESHPLDSDANNFPREVCDAILQLHQLSDMASAGFGLPTAPAGENSMLMFLANFFLEVNGTLSRLPKRHGIVLPKMRTPQSGLTLRSFSLHLAYHHSEVNVRWRSIPWVNQDENVVNIMALPIPYATTSQSFRPCEYPGKERDVKGYDYFEYQSAEKLDTDMVIELLKKAHDEVNRVHIIVFPELALTKASLNDLKTALVDKIEPHLIPMIITGLRSESADNKTERKNQVLLSVFFAGKWYDLSQDKHHRWKLDVNQIVQYSLAGALNVRTKWWWEGIDVSERCLTFMAANDWLTICPLICEDLAQLEPISALIRSVGPTLVIAILMDGPQLPHRWAARYVGVLADDPGTSILTLTSLGMALRSTAKGFPPNRTVAFWKDQKGGAEPIELKEGAEALLLTLHTSWEEEFTADARSDGSFAAVCVLRGVIQLKSDKKDGKDRKSPSAVTSESKDVKELSVFAYLADAIIDTPSDLIKALKKCALTEDEIEEIPFLKKFKPFESIWERIKLALDKDEDFKNWPTKDFKLSVEALCDFISPLNSKTESASFLERKRLERWQDLVDQAEKELQDSQNSSLISARTKTQKESNKTIWLNRIVYHSVLWAIHNRIVSETKGQSDSTALLKYRQLQNHIERILITNPVAYPH